LAAVILRRNIASQTLEGPDANIWKRLSPEAKEFVKTELLKTISTVQDKVIIHKICNLLIEVGGTMYEQEEIIWQDLLNLIF